MKNQELQYIELQYLRDELNQLCCFYCEQSNKVIYSVLITWGSVLSILGTVGAKLTGISHESVFLCFIGATIFFISNVILFLFARKYHEVIDDNIKISAYILVFYEKRPSKNVNDTENFSWELANFEINNREIDNRPRRVTGTKFASALIMSAIISTEIKHSKTKIR